MVVAIDGDPWQTDLSQYVDDENAPLTEELVMTFPLPAPGDQPVLELELANTYWLDMVMNRFFALMGDKFDKGMKRAGDESSGPRIRRWIAREGVNLKVEWKSSSGWEEVGLVSSVGPVALRHVAVPLPSAVMQDPSSAITVRVSGGAGFWRIAQAGLSTLRTDRVAARHVAPEVVQSGEGVAQRALVAATRLTPGWSR